MHFDTAAKSAAAAEQMRAAGLHNVQYLPEYGLHIYYRIPALVNKVPLSPEGNPWSLHANAHSVFVYGKGTCPRSDALFAKSVLLPIPSRLTTEQEQAAAAVIRQATATTEVPSPHYRPKLVPQG